MTTQPPSQASTNRYAGSKEPEGGVVADRARPVPAPLHPLHQTTPEGPEEIGPQWLRSHNLALSSADSFLSGGSAGYHLPRGGAKFCFAASPICLHRRYANNVLINFEETFRSSLRVETDREAVWLTS